MRHAGVTSCARRRDVIAQASQPPRRSARGCTHTHTRAPPWAKGARARHSLPAPAGSAPPPCPVPGVAPPARRECPSPLRLRGNVPLPLGPRGNVPPGRLPKRAGRTAPAASAAAARPAGCPSHRPGKAVRCGRMCAGRSRGSGEAEPGSGSGSAFGCCGRCRGRGEPERSGHCPGGEKPGGDKKTRSVPFSPQTKAAEASPGSKREFSRSQGSMLSA